MIAGQVFGAVKMNGKQLPWDVDLDVDVSKEQWDSVTKYVIPALQKKLKLSSGHNFILEVEFLTKIKRRKYLKNKSFAVGNGKKFLTKSS